ncbi:biotin-dependent carboxyltransferase family protein [Lachnospiraceae bacterium ZAX-1]
MSMKFLSPGLLTTVQDMGRFGGQQYGFSVSGVADPYSAQLANILLGNDRSEAVLEMTLMGPIIEFIGPCVIAVTGADMGALLNQKSFPLYQAVAVKNGDRISFPTAKIGCRTYLAVAGGFDVPLVLKSRSTNLKCAIGGFKGRKLQAQDILALKNEAILMLPDMQARTLSEEQLTAKTDRNIRIIPGPQEEYFTDEGLAAFYTQPYTVTPDNDRMGVKLDGTAIACHKTSDIISDGIPLGAVQIPSNGKPIIMLADRQTTGGYAKIGVVASVDIPRIAQAKAGDRLLFEKISVSKAQSLYRKTLKKYQYLEKRFRCK